MREYVVGVRKLKDPFDVRGPKAVAELLSELKDAEVEVPTVLHVNGDMTTREVETCAVGSMMSVSVEARTIFAHALRSGDGRSIILAHNHAFQKKAEPSVGDREFFHGVKQAAAVLGTHIHDSVIIGTGDYFSFMEHGILLEKSSSYRTAERELEKTVSFNVVKPDVDGRVSTPRKAEDVVSFLRKEKEPSLAVIHMTPDMEATRVEVFQVKDLGKPREEARTVLRSVVLSPSTKYFILASNEALFEKRSKVEGDVSERLRYIRLGATMLCIPVVDMILLEGKGFFSFADHGRVFPRSKHYVTVEDEGMKMKGPPKTRRADLPPYSWTFR